ncbi:MAG: preprotein translocase subunit SecE [Eubacteriales bacterium]|nr:preprotein translocase subunit SecE [Eubacteriales bacterium]
MSKFTRYFKGVGEEAKRVRWPNQKTLWKAVGIVLVISIVTALFIALFDYLTVQIMRAFDSAMPTSSSGSSSSSSGAAAMLVDLLKGGRF